LCAFLKSTGPNAPPHIEGVINLRGKIIASSTWGKDSVRQLSSALKKQIVGVVDMEERW